MPTTLLITSTYKISTTLRNAICLVTRVIFTACLLCHCYFHLYMVIIQTRHLVTVTRGIIKHLSSARLAIGKLFVISVQVTYIYLVHGNNALVIMWLGNYTRNVSVQNEMLQFIPMQIRMAVRGSDVFITTSVAYTRTYRCWSVTSVQVTETSKQTSRVNNYTELPWSAHRLALVHRSLRLTGYIDLPCANNFPSSCTCKHVHAHRAPTPLLPDRHSYLGEYHTVGYALMYLSVCVCVCVGVCVGVCVCVCFKLATAIDDFPHQLPAVSLVKSFLPPSPTGCLTSRERRYEVFTCSIREVLTDATVLQLTETKFGG